MAWRQANAIRNIMIDANVDALDTGGVATLQFRTSAQPTNPDDAPVGTLLGTCTFSATAFGGSGTPGVGQATANTVTADSSADASGTVAHARLLRGNGNIHSDANCVLSPASGDFVFDNTSIVAGGIIAVASIVATQPV